MMINRCKLHGWYLVLALLLTIGILMSGCSHDKKAPAGQTEPDALMAYDKEVLKTLIEEYRLLEEVPLSRLYDPLSAIISARIDCYGRYSDMERRNLCRKQYSRDIFFTAMQNIRSAPSKGFFMMCVRVCPITYGICKGEQHTQDSDLPELDCIKREAQCIESCLDQHWRGATHISSEAYGL